MVTSPCEWKILEWDDKLQTSKQAQSTFAFFGNCTFLQFFSNYGPTQGPDNDNIIYLQGFILIYLKTLHFIPHVKVGVFIMRIFASELIIRTITRRGHHLCFPVLDVLQGCQRDLSKSWSSAPCKSFRWEFLSVLTPSQYFNIAFLWLKFAIEMVYFVSLAAVVNWSPIFCIFFSLWQFFLLFLDFSILYLISSCNSFFYSCLRSVQFRWQIQLLVLTWYFLVPPQCHFLIPFIALFGMVL